MKSSSIFRKSQLVCAALAAICVTVVLSAFAETVEWNGEVGSGGEGDAKRPCSRITFKEMPMLYGDTSRFGKKRPYAKDPTVFKDDDGRIYLFFQGKATLKGDYSLSCVEVVFDIEREQR